MFCDVPSSEIQIATNGAAHAAKPHEYRALERNDLPAKSLTDTETVDVDNAADIDVQIWGKFDRASAVTRGARWSIAVSDPLGKEALGRGY